jgi:REP element-mobilizing transposase RayT
MQIQRKSYSEINRTYFFTATIHQWLPLLAAKENKELIVDYLKELSAREMIKIYGFVIMPNHVHFIWQQLQKNGKETPQGSFLKYTAHEFLKIVKQNGTSKLYEVNAANKKHQIWQRDSLSVEISNTTFAKQKLEYIHFNPVSGKWNLARDYIEYNYSSARFYETGVDEFGFLSNLFHG